MTTNEIMKNLLELNSEQKKDINDIISKLYNHSIAMDNPSYNFLKEIENDLKEFKKRYF